MVFGKQYLVKYRRKRFITYTTKRMTPMAPLTEGHNGILRGLGETDS